MTLSAVWGSSRGAESGKEMINGADSPDSCATNPEAMSMKDSAIPRREVFVTELKIVNNGIDVILSVEGF